jgi:uncharacterized membrane protein (UPF0127 family)
MADDKKPARKLIEMYLSTRGVEYARKPMKLVVFETPAEQTRGLQFRDPIDPHTLFLFTKISAGRVFHTENVFQPIDIAFVGADTKVIQVSTLPPDHPGIPAPSGTAAAIEAVSGLMEKAGIKVGSSFKG